jgi:rifampicin phosphotransferase
MSTQMQQMIFDPSASKADAAVLSHLGGKARSLYELGRLAGARVPHWFAVPAVAFAEAVARAGVGDGIAAALRALAATGPTRDALAACEAALAPLLAQLEPAAELARAIGDAYERLGGGHVAVRSSALDEDGVERSFAGCLDTALFVQGRDAVVAAVSGCWRSAFSERSLAYRATHGALEGEIRVAVVVQRMVDGAVSGVLFTADPSNGARDRAIVTSTWGLGEGVVSGRLACDTWVLEKSGAVLERDVVEKTHAVLHDVARGQGTHEAEVAVERQLAASLGDAQLAELVALGTRIETAYGLPVDVEWTWDATGPWVLQARPITTGATGAAAPIAAASAPTAAATPAPVAGARRRLWDNSNIIESYDGVTTPMTYSFARRAYAMVYRQAFALLGVPRRELEANAATFEQMIGLLRGRVYYNLESWYQVLKFLPAYKFNAEFMEQMMGVREKAAFNQDAAPAPRSAASRYLVDLPELVASVAKLSARFARSEALVEEFFANFAESYGDMMARPLGELDMDGLIGVYLDAEQRIMARWQAPIVNDILAMVFFGALRKALGAWGVADGEHGSLHNDLLCGEGGLESTEPTRDLLRLMVDVRQDPALCELLRTSSGPEIRAAVEAEARFGWLRVRIAAHVDRFGDRCIDELKLEQPTLRDDPTFLYGALKGYLAAPPVTVEEMEAREGRIRREAEEKVRAALKSPVRRRMFEFLVAGARRHVKNRENLRFARTRAFGLVRRLVVQMGNRLVAAGQLDALGDVFYLEINELIAFARGTGTTTDLRGLARVRKAEFAAHRAAESPPERFWTEGAVYLNAQAARSDVAFVRVAGQELAQGESLTGIGASPGVARARARLIRDPRGTELCGEVLVANRTDPGWVPLFPSAKAVVVERGSVLSHSAIVAREFGIPCVVGVRDALSRLREGQLIEVDGNTGKITLL